MTTIMCDDVRREEGGKVSYMGVYGTDLLVPELPVTLPKLCFVMTLACPGDQKPPETVSFRLFSGEAMLAEVHVPADALAQAAIENASPNSREHARLTIASVFQMFPMQLPEPTELKARAICDGVEIRGGAWNVRTLPKPTPAP